MCCPLLAPLPASSSSLLKYQSGIEKAQKLRVLMLSNNKISGFGEIDKLSSLPCLEDLLLVGNPLYNQHRDQDNIAGYRIQVGAIAAASRCLPQRQPGTTSAPTTFSFGLPVALLVPCRPPQIIKRVPGLKKLDGVPVDVDEREAAKAV